MKTLVIVDVQKDFYNPQGSLYVKEGEEVIPRIKELIEKDPQINQIIFTVDWHTLEDSSFRENGGIWPAHCIQYSEGATIPDELLDVVKARKFKNIDGVFYGDGEAKLTKYTISNTYDVFRKGDVPEIEEYGAFGGVVVGLEEDRDILYMTSASEESCSYFNQNNEVIVCGLAGDYCVLETAKNLKKQGLKIVMFMEGIRSIDDGTKLKEWMNQEEVGTYEL